MPTYEYICLQCSAPYEVRLSMSAYSAGEGRRCPACGSTDVERRITGCGVLTGSRSGAGSGATSCGGNSGFT
ncbi:MAG TPA: zinc ribbon domain-containing protein [Gemmatimonadaceae bacterium]